MAKKLSSKKGVRGGSKKQHAIAGRLGGLAPHVCRGRECSSMKKKSTKAGSKVSKARTHARKKK